MPNNQTSKGIVFIVENNKMMAKLAERLLSTMYECVIFDTPENAIWQIRKGTYPAIIITSTVFPEMSGEEFTKVISKISPRTSKVIITSKSETKDLIQLLNSSNTDFYLTKPYNNLMLLQYCKIGNELFNLREVKKVEVKDTKDENKEKLLKILEKYKLLERANYNVLSQLVKAISNLISETEKFYFRPHTKEVLSISRKLSALVGFDEETEKRMSFIALLHNHYLIGSPDKYSIIDPRFSSKDEAEKFDTHLKRSAANLANIEMLTEVAKLTALIFENMDGSGKPNGLTGLNIPKEVQVVSLVNLYHNLMYRINSDQMEELKLEGEVILRKKDILEKYKETTRILFKNIKWFDHDLFYKFQDLVKKRDTDDLKFYNRDIKIYYKKEDNAMPEFNDKSLEDHLKKQLLNTYRTYEKVDENGETNLVVEKKTKISRLVLGDTLHRDIENNEGNIVAKAGTIIDEIYLNKLTNQMNSDSISDLAYVIEEQKEELQAN